MICLQAEEYSVIVGSNLASDIKCAGGLWSPHWSSAVLQCLVFEVWPPGKVSCPPEASQVQRVRCQCPFGYAIVDSTSSVQQADGPEDPKDTRLAQRQLYGSLQRQRISPSCPRFKIFEDDEGMICAKRTDAPSPWGVHLANDLVAGM